ncbi:hypothetical protein QP158_11935, partial [Streptococcus agalactiae]|nr:hypothetical protein [Streptococcus agalactiae]
GSTLSIRSGKVSIAAGRPTDLTERSQTVEIIATPVIKYVKNTHKQRHKMRTSARADTSAKVEKIDAKTQIVAT